MHTVRALVCMCSHLWLSINIPILHPSSRYCTCICISDTIDVYVHVCQSAPSGSPWILHSITCIWLARLKPSYPIVLMTVWCSTGDQESVQGVQPSVAMHLLTWTWTCTWTAPYNILRVILCFCLCLCQCLCLVCIVT
jgi:hypothetical protein